MHAATVLGWVLVLGSVCSLQGLPVLRDPLYATQETFNLTRLLGDWHDVAVATSCPHMQRSRADAAIGTMELKAGLEAGKIQTKMTVLWGGVCKEMTLDFELTTTPGRFYYHIARWQVDAYVVHTNYREYAIVITRQESSGTPATSVRLYSRTRAVRDTVLADFKTLVRDLGMSDDTIIMKRDKGKCVPGEEMMSAQHSSGFRPVQRTRRAVVATTEAPEEEGSGFETFTSSSTFPAACKSEPDSGPCFGMQPRFFYNSSSMSCHQFQYGGCMGNHNNFVAERECLQRCRTEAVCRLPMVAQVCVGQPAVWAFDAQSGLCVAYKPGYCQGNGNKFYSKAECEEYCGVVKDGEAEFLAIN